MKEKLSDYNPTDYELEGSAQPQTLATPEFTKTQVKFKIRIPRDVRSYYSCYLDGSLDSAIDELMDLASVGRLNVVNLPPVGEPQATMFNAMVAASHAYYTTLKSHYSFREFNLSALLTDFAEQDGATLVGWPVAVTPAELRAVRATLARRSVIRQESRVTTRSLVTTHCTAPLLTGECVATLSGPLSPTLLDTVTFLDYYERFTSAVTAAQSHLAELTAQTTEATALLQGEMPAVTTVSAAVTALLRALDDTNRAFCEAATSLGHAVIFDERATGLYTTLLHDAIAAERLAATTVDTLQTELNIMREGAN